MRLTLLAIALVLSGCSSINLKQKDYAEGAPISESAVLANTKLTESWEEIPVISEGRSAVVLFTPESVPQSIKDTRIDLELEPGVTVQDIVSVLGKKGIPAIISDPDLAKKSFYFPRYVGTVGGLLSAVTRVTDAWFTWHEGTIVVSSLERIGVSVPQESNFSENLTKGLETLGVKDKAVTWQAGMAVMDITPSQFRKVKTYLERYTANAAIISLQTAVINVSLTQSAKQGIDWANLQLSALKGGTTTDLKGWAAASAPSTAPVTSAATTAATTTATVAVALPTAAVAAVGIASGALTGAIFSSHFSFSGLFNFLQTYGTAETKQNVLLKTVAGNKVEFKSLTSVPYVSEIGVTTSGVSSSTTGSTKTEKADDGIEVAMTPTYDAAANSVTIDMKLSIKAVVAYNELSAGNQIGKLTIPTTAERSFTDTLRLRPGQTVVVGGLTYDTYSNNKSAPIFLSGTSWESDSLTVNRQTMFIVIRPTVLKLGQVLSQESGETLEVIPVAAEPEPVPSKRFSSQK